MTKEEFEGWKSYRPTQEVRAYLTELKGNYLELQHQLLTNCSEVETIALQAVRLEGMITGINNFLDIAWEDVGGQEEED
jgi:hypothetical protein